MGNCCASPLRRAIRERDLNDLRNILEEAGQSSGQLIDEDTDADCCLDWMDCSRKPKSPLFTAVSMGDVNTVQLLLQYGADSNLLDYEGNTVMHFACYFNNLEMVKVLCNANPGLLSMPNYSGICPIHSVCNSLSSTTTGKIHVLTYLVEEGKVDVTVKDNEGLQAMDYAKKMKNSAAVKYFEQL